MAQIRSMAHRRPPSRVLTSNAASSQPTCSATAGGCCLRRRLRAAAYVRALPRSSTVLARQPVHMGMRGWAISSLGCSPKGVGRCSCIAAWDTQVRRSSSGQSCVAVARPSRAPPSEAPPAGRGGLARFTCGWHSLSEGEPGRNLAEGRAAAFGQRRYQLVGGRRAERSDPPSSGLASTQPVLPGSVLLLCAPLCPPAPSTPPSNPSHTDHQTPPRTRPKPAAVPRPCAHWRPCRLA